MSKYKVAYYIQVGKEKKTKGCSFEEQKFILDQWIRDMEWKWVKTYYDEVSENSTKREKFQEMISDAKHGLFDGICIVDSDRFGIPTKNLLDLMDDLLDYEVRLHVYNLQHIDIYSEQGRFTLMNLSAFREFFRGQLSAKIRAGVKQKMKTEWFGQAPYGYAIVSDDIGGRKRNTRLVKNPEEQKIIAKMKQLRDEGRSYSEIATELNKNGVPTRLTRKDKASSWYPSTVRNILNHPGVKL